MSDFSELDKRLDFERRNLIINNVREEVQHAIEDFPPMRSAHEGFAIIKEEVDELWDAIKDNKNRDVLDVHNEARQVAAMAVRFMLDIHEGNFRNERRG
jgi:NTP pyrophosphatase (non-canonical NTP hydrolase)